MLKRNRIEERFDAELQEIERNGQLRSLNAPSGVDFSSNDYLGLSSDPRILHAFKQAIDEVGVGSTGSRLLRGERAIFREAEEIFAEWKRSGASLYFATGYQANIGVLQTLLIPDSNVFSDELNHASIIDGIRLGKSERRIYRHCDVKHLRELLEARQNDGETFVITESVFSMDGDIAPLQEIAEACEDFGAGLIVDEAHAVGLFGEKGSGLVEALGLEDKVLASINTAGKSLGCSGAFVCGSRSLIDLLINRCRSFIFSTAPAPAVAAAIIEAIRIVRDDAEPREKFERIVERFHAKAVGAGIDVPAVRSHIVPIVIGDPVRAVRIANEMQKKGFDVRAIRPPTVPVGTSRLRVSLNAGLCESDVDSFVENLAEVLK